MLTQPITDLNISHTEIPPLLVQLEQAPYASPVRMDCAALQFDIDQLTRLVGPDFLSRKSIGDQAIVSEDSSTNTAWAAAHSAVSSWIPFRSELRFITGADRQERRVNDAILAGFVRRAYLKGLLDQHKCPPV